MTSVQLIEFEKQLSASGCWYDGESELFMSQQGPLATDEVLALLPGRTLDDLTAYQDVKWNALSAARQRNSQADRPD